MSPQAQGAFASRRYMNPAHHHVMMFGPNEEIFGETKPTEYVYKVINGAVRTYKIFSDGRRQTGGFWLPGDIFGLEIGSEHQSSAEAINNATVMMIRRSTVVSRASRNCEAAQQLWTLTSHELYRVQDHMMLLVKNAQQRVACFLLEMSERTRRERCDRSSDVAPGHCGLPRAHHRDGFAHHVAARVRPRHWAAERAPRRATESPSSARTEFVKVFVAFTIPTSIAGFRDA